jgi:ribosomal protein S12 methylthiotransferase
MTPRLLELMAGESRIVEYLDMPIQHASDAVLERMRRPERARTIRERVARVREVVPDVSLRTTCIVGFPGETADDFQYLLDFLEEVQFDRVGAFAYSPQEGTRAQQLADDVPDEVKLERLERVTDLQRAVTGERYERLIGRQMRAIVDRAGERTEARTMGQADDIDGVTWLEEPVAPGSIVDLTVSGVENEYDLTATLDRIVVPPAQSATLDHGRRVLPLATMGSFGR